MPHLAVSGVHAKYGALEVLHGITFGVERGEVVSLVGPSGSGKSTVLRTLVGLTPVSKGSVDVDGVTIDYASGRSIRAARDRMAIVFQQYNLFQNMNVLRNVTLAPTRIKKRPRAEVEDEAMELLRLVGLSDKHDAFPDELSGGQQQRVAIARALSNRPKLLLADEPTGNLDQHTADDVFALLLNLVKETRTGALVATHNLALAGRMDRVLDLRDGAIVSR